MALSAIFSEYFMTKKIPCQTNFSDEQGIHGKSVYYEVIIFSILSLSNILF